MAGKKKGPKQNKPKTTEKAANGKQQPQPTTTNRHNKKSTQKDSTGGGIPFLVCLVVGLLSLACGLLSPHLWKAWRDPPPGRFAAQPPKNKNRSRKLKESNMPPKHEFPCHKEALSKVLHEEPVEGLHVICMDQSMKSLKVTLFPGASVADPLVQELEGLPDWTAFKSTLEQSLQLRPMDDLHQPWGLFSPDGELLLKENNDQVEMAGLVQMGMVLLFQGGQFVWPGVRIGFQRTIDLYSVMPGGSPQFAKDKHRFATLETISLKPLVFSVEGFLDPDECDFFQQQAAPTMAYSEVTLMDMDQGRPASDFRTSQSTFLENNNHAMIRDIDYRTASLVRVPRFHQENVQVLRYGGGEKYDAHHDYFDKALYQNDQNTLQNFIQYGRRNRMITVFWYLSDVEEGGETVFPRFGGTPPPRNMSDCSIGLKVQPVRGKVIIFYSLKADGSLDPLSLHGACPVKKGIKWAANKWVWNLPIEFGSGR